MSAFPKDLVNQCLLVAGTTTTTRNTDDISQDNNHDRGTLLQLVLSVLEDENVFPTLEYFQTFLKEKLGTNSVGTRTMARDKTATTNSSSSADNDDEAANRLTQIMYDTFTAPTISTKSLVTTVQNNINNNPTEQGSTATTCMSWYIGLQLIALFLRQESMTAFEVHSVALQSATTLLGVSKSIHQCLVWTLIVLLCTWALETCQQQIQQANPDKPIRWKRIQSLILETVQLYQRHALCEIEEEDEKDMNEKNMVEDETLVPFFPSSLTIPLWIHHICPVGLTLWKLFPDTIRPPSSLFWQATSVSVASHLAVRLPACSTSSSTMWLYHLYQYLLQLELPMDMIWCHPWRIASHYHRQYQQSTHDRLDYWALERSIDDVDNDADDDESSSIEHDPYEALDTSWSELGIAMLVWASKHDKCRPQIYHPLYQWRLCFPHVAILLNPEQHPISQSANTTTTNISLQCMTMGISLLKELLPIVPDCSLSMPVSFSLATPTRPTTTSVQHDKQHYLNNKHGRPLPPDHPVGTFQLLLNGIVSSASVSHMKQSPLPTAMELFQLCKTLLSKYTLSCQMDIVLDHLLPNCPHPGLRPKILDMLRPLLARVLSMGATKDSGNNNREVRDQLGQSLETMLGELGNYCIWKQEQSGAPILCLQNVEDLLDETEYFVAVCAMIQLGWNIMQNTRGIDKSNSPTHPRAILLKSNEKLSKTAYLQDFHTALQVQLEEWNLNIRNNKQAPNEFFRLNLLDNAIQQLMELAA